MRWCYTHRFDAEALVLADRHYNRQKPGSPQYVPPGRNICLIDESRKALWVTSWPRFARHAWQGAWINTLFRNEGAGLSSELILEACAATRADWGDPPEQGLVTFVDASKIRHKRDPGRCYRKAGFQHVGFTKVNHLWVFQLLPQSFPPAEKALIQTGGPLFEVHR